MSRAVRELRLLARDPLLLGLVVLIMAALLVFVLYPVVLVLRHSLVTPDGLGLDNYELLAQRRLYRNALRNSLGVATLVGALSVVLGYVVAFTLARTDVPLKRALHNLTILPIVSPPFSGAISILFLFGFNGLVTRHLLGLQDFSIYGFWGVVASQVFTFTPIAYLSLRGVLAGINPTLEDAAMNVGATRWQVFRRVVLPRSEERRVGKECRSRWSQ